MEAQARRDLLKQDSVGEFFIWTLSLGVFKVNNFALQRAVLLTTLNTFNRLLITSSKAQGEHYQRILGKYTSYIDRISYFS